MPPEERGSRRPRPRLAVVEERASGSIDPRAEPESDPVIPKAPAAPKDSFDGLGQRGSTRPPPASSPMPARREPGSTPPTPLRPPEDDDEDSLVTIPRHGVSVSSKSMSDETPRVPRSSIPAPPSENSAFLTGAEQPLYRQESPPPSLSRAPLLPKLGGPSDELAEHLALPPGVATDVRIDVLPQSVLEARIQFTLLARELGLDYRLKRGLELRADASGLEAMQAVLLEVFPTRTVRHADDAYEVRRHGALVAEILARRLGAEWIDIRPSHLGHWAMVVPPDTMVWPFGRIARFIQQGHRERDLVSYFFELQSRAHGR
jgi:hypothetical protein